jgi:hypothetical protein
MMMMEAMRLSLLEHEEEQRRQAQSQSREDNPSSAPPSSAPTQESSQEVSVRSAVLEATSSQAQSAPLAGTTHSRMQQQQQQSPPPQPQQVLPRMSSLSNDAPFIPSSTGRYSLTHQELGISSSMMAELSELVEGEGPFAPSTPNSAYTTPASPQVVSNNLSSTPASSFAPGSPMSSSTTTPPRMDSPSRIGTNPNNPFRRLAGSSHTSPSHSRQSSTVYTGWPQNMSGS